MSFKSILTTINNGNRNKKTKEDQIYMEKANNNNKEIIKEIKKDSDTNKNININKGKNLKKKRYHKREKNMRLQRNKKNMKTTTTNKTNKQHFLKKKQTEVNYRHRDDPWGDKLTKSNLWPGETEQTTIRIMTQNVNGISHFYDYYEWDHVLHTMHQDQVDILGITEVNLDLSKPAVKYKLIQRAKKLDNNFRMAMSASKYKSDNEAFKMGGTMTITKGNWSGRITKSGQDKLGRWSFIDMTGKNGKKYEL